jgi:ABC-type iron transport system FetAB ATPase subunit
LSEKELKSTLAEEISRQASTQAVALIWVSSEREQKVEHKDKNVQLMRKKMWIDLKPETRQVGIRYNC